jgi:hypothetical protein
MANRRFKFETLKKEQRPAILIMERGYWVSAICQFVNNCQSLFV